MREKRWFSALGFPTTFDALEAERVLLGAGLVVRTIPRPNAIGGAECGIAVRVEIADTDQALEVLGNAAVHVSGSTAIEDF